MAGQEHVQPAPEEEVDPDEQDRRHASEHTIPPGRLQYERGLELIRAGSFFEAHEELETAWRAAEPTERDFLQGLVHVAVAWYQASRGNRYGCERQLAKARRRLEPYAPAHGGLDVDALLASLGEAESTVAGGSLDLPVPRLGGG